MTRPTENVLQYFADRGVEYVKRESDGRWFRRLRGRGCVTHGWREVRQPDLEHVPEAMGPFRLRLPK